jgi:uncharacterized protein (DUF1800 family)
MVHFSGIGDDRDFELQRQEAAQKGRSMFAFCEAPVYHDSGFKTVLGRTAAFDGDMLLDHLASHPLTARRIPARLFEFFVGRPAPEVRLKAMAQIWEASGGDLKPILRHIAECDEFWDERSVRTLAKSPVDFSIAFLRQLGVQEFLRGLAAAEQPGKPANAILKAIGTVGFFLMAQQGMTLFYPPDVGGWEWGPGWITSTNTLERLKHPDLLFVGDDPARPIAALLATEMKAAGVSDGKAVAAFLAARFDFQPSPDQLEALGIEAERLGGARSLDGPEPASRLISALVKSMVAAPSFQQC